MSSPGAGNAAATGKKAVHVKWAGKTIALGTFPSAEADEKCQKAKALTRAWRSTMRPKPSREWVMLELERLGVRVVSGRLGRKAGEEEGEQGMVQDKQKAMPNNDAAGGGNMGGAGAGMMQRNGSLGWGSGDDLTNLMARRNSSLGLSMMNDTLGRRGSLGSLGQVMGLDTDPSIPPHRPFVGGGAAAAYEAARHDHFAQKSAEQQRRASGLGLGGLAGGGLGGMGMSVNPNQHYEMLKLHHMNLLNEIQETTLMMNLYQQQQLQQQQQQLAEQQSGMGGSSGGSASGNAVGGDSQISMLMQQNGAGGNNQSMDNLFPGGNQLAQRNSLGLGGGSFSGLGDMAGNMASMQSSGMQNVAFNKQQQGGGADGANQMSALKADGGAGSNNAAGSGQNSGDTGVKREVGDDPTGSPQAKRVKTEDGAEESKDAKA